MSGVEDRVKEFLDNFWKVKEVAMTNFDEGSYKKCPCCGDLYFVPEGPLCDCWNCSNCGEWFSDFDMLANRNEWLCLYCEDERYREEMKVAVDKCKNNLKGGR